MLGNDTLREAFAVGLPNAEIARTFLDWLRTTRRRTPLTVYQCAAKSQSFLAWIEPAPLDAANAGDRGLAESDSSGPSHGLAWCASDGREGSQPGPRPVPIRSGARPDHERPDESLVCTDAQEPEPAPNPRRRVGVEHGQVGTEAW
jgi:hypothetical protein